MLHNWVIVTQWKNLMINKIRLSYVIMHSKWILILHYNWNYKTVVHATKSIHSNRINYQCYIHVYYYHIASFSHGQWTLDKAYNFILEILHPGVFQDN